MPFLYVDRITAYESGRSIRGVKNVTRTEPYLLTGPDGKKTAHPLLLIEAFAQLSAWLAILDHKFEKRPLFLGEDVATLPAPVLSGDQVHLAVDLIRYSDDVVETRGSATVGGRTVFTSECGRGYLVPTETFEERRHVEWRFRELNRMGMKPGKVVSALPDASHANVWRMSRRPLPEFVDGVVAMTPLAVIETVKNVAASEEFFDGHFPHKPVVPGVVIMSMVLDAAEMLTRAAPEPLGSLRRLRLDRVANVRFRQMVEPGDQCVVKAKVKAWNAHTRKMTLTAAVFVGPKRVAQVEMDLTATSRLPAEGPGNGKSDATAV